MKENFTYCNLTEEEIKAVFKEIAKSEDAGVLTFQKSCNTENIHEKDISEALEKGWCVVI